MIDTFVTFNVLPDRTAEFERLHRELLARVCTQPGCVNVRVHRSVSNPLEYMVHGTLMNKDAWERAHQTTPEFKPLLVGCHSRIIGPVAAASSKRRTNFQATRFDRRRIHAHRRERHGERHRNGPSADRGAGLRRPRQSDARTDQLLAATRAGDVHGVDSGRHVARVGRDSVGTRPVLRRSAQRYRDIPLT